MKGASRDGNGSLCVGRGKPDIFLCVFVAPESQAKVNTTKEKTILIEDPSATHWYASWVKTDLRL